jgi:hypothetical protein
MPLRPVKLFVRRSVCLVIIVFVLAALPAHADLKKILMIVPTAAKRTAINMVTFQNRESAFMQWVDVAAGFADAETTRRSLNRGSSEFNPFLGRRPSTARVYFTLIGIGFNYATMTQIVQDRVEKPRPFKFGITSLAATSHAYAAYHNTTICPGNVTCNQQPTN